MRVQTLPVPMAELAPASHAAVKIRDRARGAQRSHIDVLTLDAQTRQTVTCLRELSHLGLGVGAVACESDAGVAPGLRSRWSRMQAVVPDLAIDASRYTDALLALLDQYPARMILPGHDGTIEAIRAQRAEFERKVIVPLASEAALDVAVSKARTLALGTTLGIAVPRSVAVEHIDDVAAAMREIGGPVVIKPVVSWVESDGVGVRLTSAAVRTVDEAKYALSYFLSSGGSAVFQQWLPGRREAVTMLYAQGHVRARFAQASHREYPVLGGVSTFSESIPLTQDIARPAEELIRAMNLEGCSMVEFRRDSEGRPALMEINPRMGGSVALPVACGMNFPQLVYAWASGAPISDVSGYRVGRRLRWLSGDIQHLKCVFKSPYAIDTPPRSRAAVQFFADFALRPSAIDFLDPLDMGPAIMDMRQIVVDPGLKKLRTLLHVRAPKASIRIGHPQATAESER